MECQHSLVAQEEQSCENEIDLKGQATETRRCGLRPWAAVVAVLGLAAAALSLGLTMPSAVVNCTEFPPRRSLAWAGQLRGPVERRLNANSVGDAIAILTHAAKVAKEIEEEVLRITSALALEGEPRVSEKRLRKRAKARCVLETLAVAESVAKIGTNLKASVSVCTEDPLFLMLPGKFGRLVRGLKKWICVINIELVLIGFFSVVSNLANAAVSCSNAANISSSLNMGQQVDAGCTSAAVIMVNSLVTLSTAFQLTIPGCSVLTLGVEQQLKAGLGSLNGGGAAEFGKSSGNVSRSERLEIIKRLENSLTPENFGSASSFANLVDPAGSARRLFLGGGPGAFMTMCVVDVLQALTSLSLMGVTLDSIVNAGCQDPRVGPVTAKAVPKPLRDRVENGRRADCASSISAALANLGMAVLFLSFTSFHCTNKMNVQAICGAGIAGIEASLAGVASSGAGAYLACTEGKRRKQTEFLIAKSLENFVKEKAEQVLEDACPDLSMECFIEFSQFFQTCPSGVSASCPVTPSSHACPGIQTCVTEFDAYRGANMGTPWLPIPGDGHFVNLVAAIPACWEYLNCFHQPTSRRLSEAEPKKLQSHAMRSLLLQKVFRSDAWNATSGQTSARTAVSAVPEEMGMELVEQLFSMSGYNLSQPREEHPSPSLAVLRASWVGERILDQVSNEWQQQKVKGDMCFDSSPLLDESETTIP